MGEGDKKMVTRRGIDQAEVRGITITALHRERARAHKVS